MYQDLVVTIIPNWNLKSDLSECLDSVLLSKYSAHQIVVVDNGSNDGSVDFVKEKYPKVHVIPLSKNLGYAGALNEGIRYSIEQNAKYIFVLNNDTVIYPDTIGNLIKILNSDNAIGIISPKILYYDNPKIMFGLGDKIYRFLPVPFGIGYRKYDHPRYEKNMEFDYVTGCAMLFKTDLVNTIGFFDTSFFMYYEDSDFCYRTRKIGKKIICAGKVSILHKTAISTGKNKQYSTWLRARNRVWFFKRYPHGLHPWLTYLDIIIIAFYKSIRFLITGNKDLLRPYINGLIEGWKKPVPEIQY